MMFFFVKRFFYIIFYKTFNFVAPQEGENIILERIFSKQFKGLYVDVGAHHPVRFSNTYNLHQKGWAGINIEPNPEAIKVFKKMRPKDVNLNVAISNLKNTCNYYKFKEPALNTTDIKIVKMREKQGYKCIKKINVPTQTLNQVLSKFCKKNSSIDLLKIDVEGKELDVLKSNNWKKAHYLSDLNIAEREVGYLFSNKMKIHTILNFDLKQFVNGYILIKIVGLDNSIDGQFENVKIDASEYEKFSINDEEYIFLSLSRYQSSKKISSFDFVFACEKENLLVNLNVINDLEYECLQNFFKVD